MFNPETLAEIDMTVVVLLVILVIGVITLVYNVINYSKHNYTIVPKVKYYDHDREEVLVLGIEISKAVLVKSGKPATLKDACGPHEMRLRILITDMIERHINLTTSETVDYHLRKCCFDAVEGQLAMLVNTGGYKSEYTGGMLVSLARHCSNRIDQIGDDYELPTIHAH